MSELIYRDDRHARVRLGNDGIEACRELKIYFSNNHDWTRAWPDSEVLLRPELKILPYVGYLAGSPHATATLTAMDSFSYSWSDLPLDLTIGRYCSIAAGVTFGGESHPLQALTTSPVGYDRSFSLALDAANDLGSHFVPTALNSWTPPAVIEHDVWIGQGAAIKRGIRLGTGCVVGAFAVVTKDVEPYAIVAGNPARVIRKRFDDKLCQRLLESEWWRYAFPAFAEADMNDPIAFLHNVDFDNLSVYDPTPHRFLEYLGLS